MGSSNPYMGHILNFIKSLETEETKEEIKEILDIAERNYLSIEKVLQFFGDFETSQEYKTKEAINQALNKLKEYEKELDEFEKLI